MVQLYSNTNDTKGKKPVWVGSRVVGSIAGGAFFKTVTGSKHRLRRPPAWCIAKSVFNEEILPNCREIVVKDRESGLEYRTTVEVFNRHCFELQRGNFEPQLALGLVHWKVVGGKEIEPGAPEAVLSGQLGFWR